MRIVISGGTGFIGRRLARVLSERGDEVTVLSRDPARARGSLPPAVHVDAWNPEGSDVPAALGAAEGVVHLAGEQAVGTRWTPEVKREILESRVRSTEHLVRAMQAVQRRPSVFVCASGVGYYGPRGDEPVGEDASPGSDFLAQVTIAWEKAAAGAEALGVRVVRTRFGIVFGRGGGALAEMAKPFRLFVGGPIASGRQVVSWIHLDDVAAILARCLHDPSIRGPVNVASPQAVTNEELSRAIGKALRRPSVFRVPEAALRLRFGEGADPLVTGQRAVPDVLTKAEYEFRYTRVEDAVAEALG